MSSKLAYLLHKLRAPKTRTHKASPPNESFRVKTGFATSEYSGPLSMGRFVYRNPMGMPGPTSMPQRRMTTTPEPDKPRVKLSNVVARAFVELGMLEKEGYLSTPAARLSKARAVGKPRTTSPPGPSVAQIAKPVGFGTPLPGATKGAA